METLWNYIPLIPSPEALFCIGRNFVIDLSNQVQTRGVLGAGFHSDFTLLNRHTKMGLLIPYWLKCFQSAQPGRGSLEEIAAFILCMKRADELYWDQVYIHTLEKF